MKKLAIILLLVLSAWACQQTVENKEEIQWQDFGTELFKNAKASNKYIILDLKANWCHWCHVMDDSTYSNPAVIDKIKTSFLAVKTDQDANPELANRYRKYGWPATIIFSPTGEEVFKNAGYIAPKVFLDILDRISKGEKIETNQKDRKTYAITSVQNLLEKRHSAGLDFKIGGANSNMKSISFSDFEYAVNHQTDSLKSWIDLSINGAYNLVDPEFGGIYQYSTYRRWTHQHFEKLLARQARYINIFCMDYQLNSRITSLNKADLIYQYVYTILKGDGPLFYSSQDADLVPGEHSEDYFKLSKAERLKKGMPKVDTNTYTNYNAQMVNALLALWVSKQDNQYLKQAEDVFDYLNKNRKNSNLLYAHSNKDAGIDAFDDNIKILSASFNLFKSTQDIKYFSEAKAMLDTMLHLYHQNGLAISYLKNNGLVPQPIIYENIEWCRLLNYAGHLYADTSYIAKAKQVQSILLKKVSEGRIYENVELLTIEEEINTEPLHAVIIYENEAYLQKAIQASQSMLPYYLIIESYSVNAIPENIADMYGNLTDNTTFFCTSSSCSAPLKTTEAIKKYVKQSP